MERVVDEVDDIVAVVVDVVAVDDFVAVDDYDFAGAVADDDDDDADDCDDHFVDDNGSHSCDVSDWPRREKIPKAASIPSISSQCTPLGSSRREARGSCNNKQSNKR